MTKSACSKEFQSLIACFQKAVCHSLCTAIALDRNGEFSEVESEMKIKRYKRAQRLIGFYRNNFGFTKPYRVLVDGTFCQAALTNRINLREQVSKYLNEETELATTSCVLKELGWSLIVFSSSNCSFVYCRAVGSGIVWCAAHLQAIRRRSMSAQTS